MELRGTSGYLDAESSVRLKYFELEGRFEAGKPPRCRSGAVRSGRVRLSGRGRYSSVVDTRSIIRFPRIASDALPGAS